MTMGTYLTAVDTFPLLCQLVLNLEKIWRSVVTSITRVSRDQLISLNIRYHKLKRNDEEMDSIVNKHYILKS